MQIRFEGGECRIAGTAAELRPFVCCAFELYNDTFTRALRDQLAKDYWGLAFEERRTTGDFRGAHNIIMMCTLGEEAGNGQDGLCRAETDGEPLGLICARVHSGRFVDRLYADMLARNLITRIDENDVPPAWEGSHDFPSGIRVARYLWEGQGHAYWLTGLRALAIAEAVCRLREPVLERVAA